MVKKKTKFKKKVSETKETKIKEEKLKGLLISNRTIVSENIELAQALYDRSSFGEFHGREKKLELSLVESLFLLEKKKLDLYFKGKKLNFKTFLAKATRLEKNFWNRFSVYRDFRNRGYILKTALKFGADFRVYPRGVKPGQQHAKWILFCASEGEKLTWRQFSAMNRVAHSTRKKLLVGIVDDEGDVTYYLIGWIKP